MSDFAWGVMLGIGGVYAASTIGFLAFWSLMIGNAPIEEDSLPPWVDDPRFDPLARHHRERFLQ